MKSFDQWADDLATKISSAHTPAKPSCDTCGDTGKVIEGYCVGIHMEREIWCPDCDAGDKPRKPIND